MAIVIQSTKPRIGSTTMMVRIVASLWFRMAAGTGMAVKSMPGRAARQGAGGPGGLAPCHFPSFRSRRLQHDLLTIVLLVVEDLVALGCFVELHVMCDHERG